MHAFRIGTLVLSLALAAPAAANEGAYDNGYGTQGREVIGELGSVYADTATLMLPDGRLLTAATSRLSERILVFQLRTDGTLDPAFGTTGIGYTELPPLNVENHARGITLAANGRIVVVGDDGVNTLVLYEVNSVGVLTRSAEFNFNNAGGTPIASEAADIAALPNGQLLVAGAAWVGSHRDIAVARVNEDFSRDTGFASQGTYLEGFGFSGLQDDRLLDLELRGDGRFLVAGNSTNNTTFQSNAIVVQFEANGTPDIDFGNFGGIYFTNGPRSVESQVLRVDGQGRVLVGGWIDTVNSTELWIHRLLESGASDFGFGVGANVVVPFDLGGTQLANFDVATALDIDPQGRILAGGLAVRNAITRSQAVVVARVGDDGMLDPSFGVAGKSVGTFAEPAIITFDNGNAVASIHATPLGIVMTGASAGQPDNFGFARYYAATLRLGGDTILASGFESGEGAP